MKATTDIVAKLWSLCNVLRDESLQSAEDLPEPDEIAAQITLRLQTALEDMEALTELLEAEN